jgi:hypothetical protein
MRPGCPFYCALLLDSELDSNFNCFWPPSRGLEPDQPCTSFLTWKPLLDFFYSIPCTDHGRMHGCHVLITVRGFWPDGPCGPCGLSAAPGQTVRMGFADSPPHLAGQSARGWQLCSLVRFLPPSFVFPRVLQGIIPKT